MGFIAPVCPHRRDYCLLFFRTRYSQTPRYLKKTLSSVEKTVVRTIDNSKQRKYIATGIRTSRKIAQQQ